MGSFDYTCCVSGLPISAGDDIRFLLLMQNPWYRPNENTCYITDRWFPRTYPIRAKYNDYGSIEGMQGDFLRDLVLKGFQYDLIEQGTGDNTCHDVPVRKDMNFDQLLKALWEGRVLVTDEAPSVHQQPHLQDLVQKAYALLGVPQETPIPDAEEGLHPGIPTMRRIRAAIVEAGLPLSDEGFCNGFLVDEFPNGFVRVRYGAHPEQMHLEELQWKLPSYATCITVGTGNYPDRAEMLIAPKPLPPPVKGEEPSRYNRFFEERQNLKEKRMPVAQAMIREDVWQALCGIRLAVWYDIPPTCEEWRRLARQLWATYLDDTPAKRAARLHDLVEGNTQLVDPKDVVGFSLRSHFDLARQANPTGADLEDFLDTIGELAFIQQLLSNVRYQWHPRGSHGPQFGEWCLHLQVSQALTGIAERRIALLKDDGWYEDESEDNQVGVDEHEVGG